MKSRRTSQRRALVNLEASATGLFSEFVAKYYGKSADWTFLMEGDVQCIEVGAKKSNVCDYISLPTAYEVMKYGFTRKQYFAFIDQSLTERGCPTAYCYKRRFIDKK